MSSAAKQTRHAIAGVLKTAFEAQDTLGGIDVMDWYSAEYAEAVAVIVGASRSDISRDRFASPASIPFGETWVFDLSVETPAGHADHSEISDLIHDVGDFIIRTLGADTNLSGQVEGLKRCYVTAFDVDIPQGGDKPRGLVTVTAEYRIDRSR